MSNNQEFACLLKNIQSTNRYIQASAVKTIATYIQVATKNEIQEILELLISTNDVQAQVKLLSILAAYLLNNAIHFDVIVNYNPIYETVQNLLIRGLPLKAAVALNFVLVLVSCDDGEQKHLAVHARNMLRLSGCLNTMAEMFSGNMIYQDTWVALCQSLAEACRGSEINQSYCSHLVPLCVRRCQQGNMDVCAVLQSLINKHDRNVKLFIESGGLKIFTRQALHYNMCMQLLNTVVEKSVEAVSELQNTDIVYQLQDFLRLYGPYSQMGQWSTIILYHFNQNNTTTVQNEINDHQHEPNIDTSVQEKIPQVKDRTRVFDVSNVSKANHKLIPNSSRRSVFIGKPRNNVQPRRDVVYSNDSEQDPEDTAHLFQNVIKEVIYWKSQYNKNRKRCPTPTPLKPLFKTTQQPLQVVNLQNSNFRNNRKFSTKAQEKDLTFSFLIQENQQYTQRESFAHRNKIEDSLSFDNCNISNILNNSNEKELEKQINNSISHDTKNVETDSDIDLANFKPAFVSTPKRYKIGKNDFSITSRRRRRPKKYVKRHSNISKFTKAENTTNNQDSILNPTKDIKQKSMSSRLFSAINDSCTTFVKSVKSIFRSKKNDKEKDKEIVTEQPSCSYSFTNYMRKRDALLEGEFSGEDSASGIYKVDSCKTCKDTIILQQKMAEDDHLKQTVKKLKMGIYLYGCDFKENWLLLLKSAQSGVYTLTYDKTTVYINGLIHKKLEQRISNTMWPRNKYMTPEMLYNLYRKLIVKGGHRNHEFRQKAYDIMRRK